MYLCVSQVEQMDDCQMGDNINRMKVYRFESCPDYLIYSSPILVGGFKKLNYGP
jgi:hypothetical protein